MMKFLIKYVLPVIAAGLFAVAVFHVVRTNREPETAPSRVNDPPQAEFKHTVAGAGLVEARTENIALGSPVPGIVQDVFVTVGKHVSAETPLFRLRTVELESQLQVKKAALNSARADFNRLRNLPREEEKAVKAAAVEEAKVTVDERRRKFHRTQQAYKKNAVTEDELDTARLRYELAVATHKRAVADLNLLKAGASKDELKVAQAAIEQAQKDVEQIETEIERRTIRAPVDGEVLQVNVRPGEYIGAPPGEALILLGNTRPLHVRVDIDEHDIPRFQPGAEAVAMIKGHPRLKYRLSFVRVEPYVVPKRSLTGRNTERIDTRVLQVIYAFEDANPPVYVGQQMDVFIRGRQPADR